MTINEFLHTPLEDISEKLENKELEISNVGARRYDRLVRKKKSPEYNISRWEFIAGRQDGEIKFYVFSAYCYRRGSERTLFTISFSPYGLIFRLVIKYGPLDYDLSQIDYRKTLADYIEEAKKSEDS